ncbi:hypothetical protein BDV23DRAFT_176780 [Aspergillus alliaceus]|uniref:Uncharacterized protein n=1 Tax=Petromyces alliaceus TaxID=209559 RepID=A0A5N7BSJ1_PETAA|nr:hypothetical protein BDV23DRAFT_176780 [Aspergillus alliaceus]
MRREYQSPRRMRSRSAFVPHLRISPSWPSDISAELRGKVAIVTGGGSGSGAAIARHFGEEGAKVIITDINVEGGQKVAAQNPESIVFQQMDVTKAGDWTPTAEVTEEEWERVFNVNVKGNFLGSQAFVARLIQQGQGGSVINISSTGASRPRPGLVWYNASNGAVSNVSYKGLAAEYGPHNFRVNTVSPLLSGTGLFSIKKFIENVPLGRLTDPDDVANMCLYLASDEGSFIKGTEIIVDGGKCI